MSKEVDAKPNRYNLGDKVIARWIDGKRYPGQIHQVLTSDSYMVLFEDGLQKVVKVNHIEPNVNPVPRCVLPFQDARQQRAIHESDICDLIVNCKCGSFVDTGFMIQCEHCLTFQHADCLDVETDADLLEAITCPSCLNPKGVRESCRYKFDHSWLKDSTLPNLIPNKDELTQANKRIASVNSLLQDALECIEVLHGLRAKIPLKNKQTHSSEELKCWSMSWLKTDFKSLPAIQNTVTKSVKSSTPSKAKGKSKKPRSARKDKKISKGSLDLDNIDSCSSMNADDSNLSSTTITNQVISDVNGVPMKQNESVDMKKSLELPNTFSTCTDNLDENCQKNLDEHIESIRSRLEIRLEYIESRVDELEEWYGPDLDPNDIEANRTEFRMALKNLYSNLEAFKRIQALIKCQNFWENEQSTSESEQEYQRVVKSARKKKK